MSVQINVQASQSALAQSIAQGVAAFNSRYAGQNQLNLQINARNFSQPLGRITSDLADFESALKASNARVLAFGASTAVLGGVVRSFKEIANVTLEVEKSLTDINRVLNLSTSGLQKFSSELFNVSKQTASSFDDASKAALEFSRQGLNTEETLKRTADALTLVRLTGISSTKAVEDLTATINGFSKAGLTTSQVVNKLAAVEQDFAVSASDLTEALSRTGQAAQEAGVSFDELNALVTTAQQNTARGGAVIGNALKTIFTRLQRTETLDQLENFNIAVRDIEGNILPAVQILKNFADQYNNLADAQRAQLSEQVAGVYQVNILKGVIKDLNNNQGTYVQALQRGAMAANEAEIANQRLNKTLSALVTQTGIGLQQLANNVGKVTFAPIFEAIVSPVNDAVSYINDTLEGEGIGSIFANGLLKGVRNVIAGPGLAVAFAVIAKVAKNTFEDATKALPAILGLTTEAQKRANIEKSIISILQTQSNLSLALQGQQGNLSTQAATVLNYARLQTAQYQQQLQVAQQLAPLLAAQNVTVGTRGIQVGPRIKAGGHIPAFAEMSERMGAAMGGYKSGKVVKAPKSVGANTYMNSAEEVKYVAGFAQPFINPPAGSKAGRAHRQNSISRTGIDPYMFSGFIPNFVSTSLDAIKLNNNKVVRERTDFFDNFTANINPVELNKSVDQYTKEAANIVDSVYVKVNQRKATDNPSPYNRDALAGFIKQYKGKVSSSTLKRTSTALKNPDNWLYAQNQVKGLLGEADAKNLFENSKVTQKNDFFDLIKGDGSLAEVRTRSKINKKDILVKAILERLKMAYYKNGENESINLGSYDVVIPKGSTLNSQGFIPNFATPMSTASIPWFKKYSSKYKNAAGDADLFKMGDFPTYGRGLDHEYAKKGNSAMLSYLHEDFVRSALNIALGSKKVIRPAEVGFKNKPVSDIANENDFDLLYRIADGSYDLLELKQDFKNISGSVSGFMNKKLENAKKDNPELVKKVRSMIAVSNRPKFTDPTGRNAGANFSEFEMAAASIVKDKYSNVDPSISAKLTKVTDGLLRRYEAKKNTTYDGFIPNFAGKDIVTKFFRTQTGPDLFSSKGTGLSGTVYRQPGYRSSGYQLKEQLNNMVMSILGNNVFFPDASSLNPKIYGDVNKGAENSAKTAALKLSSGGKTSSLGLGAGMMSEAFGNSRYVPDREAVFTGQVSGKMKRVNYDRLSDILGAFWSANPETKSAWESLKNISETGKFEEKQNIRVKTSLLKKAYEDFLVKNNYIGTRVKLNSYRKRAEGVEGVNYGALRSDLAGVSNVRNIDKYGGFIPNFAYKQAVMGLEESMSGNKAVFDTKPFPHIRNSSQPTFSSAISDHGGLSNALNDSMRNQEAAGLMSKGFVPNFATVNTQAGFGLPFGALNTSERKLFVDMNKALSKLTRDLTLTSQQQNTLRQTILNNAYALQASTGSTDIVTEANKALTASLQQNANAQQKAATQAAQQQAAQQQAAQQPVQQTLSTRLLGTSRGGKFDKVFGRLTDNIGFNLAAPLLGGVAESLIAGGKDRSEMGYGERLASSGVSAALTGLSTGAAIGSAIPGIGTAAGAAIGAIVGFSGAALNARTTLDDLSKSIDNVIDKNRKDVEAAKSIGELEKQLAGETDPFAIAVLRMKIQEAADSISNTEFADKLLASSKSVEEFNKTINEFALKSGSLNKLSNVPSLIKSFAKQTKTFESRTFGMVGETFTGDVFNIFGINNEKIQKKIEKTYALAGTFFDPIGIAFMGIQEEIEKKSPEAGKDFADILNNIFEFKESGVLKEKLKPLIDNKIISEQLAAEFESVVGIDNAYFESYLKNLKTRLPILKDKMTKLGDSQAARVAESESLKSVLAKINNEIQNALNEATLQLMNIEFKSNIGKLNIEKIGGIFDSAASAIGKNLESIAKAQFDALMVQVQLSREAQLADLNRTQFQETGTQERNKYLAERQSRVSAFFEKNLAPGEDSRKAGVQALAKIGSDLTYDFKNLEQLTYNMGVNIENARKDLIQDEEFKKKSFLTQRSNAETLFDLEQSYAKDLRDLKKKTSEEDLKLEEVKYANLLREKQIIQSFDFANQTRQIQTQAEISRMGLGMEVNPNFFAGASRFQQEDYKFKLDREKEDKRIAAEIRTATEQQRIVDIQRQVMSANTDATNRNTEAIRESTIAFLKQQLSKVESEQSKSKNSSKEIENTVIKILDQEAPLVRKKTFADPGNYVEKSFRFFNQAPQNNLIPGTPLDRRAGVNRYNFEDSVYQTPVSETSASKDKSPSLYDKFLKFLNSTYSPKSRILSDGPIYSQEQSFIQSEDTSIPQNKDGDFLNFLNEGNRYVDAKQMSNAVTTAENIQIEQQKQLTAEKQKQVDLDNQSKSINEKLQSIIKQRTSTVQSTVSRVSPDLSRVGIAKEELKRLSGQLELNESNLTNLQTERDQTSESNRQVQLDQQIFDLQEKINKGKLDQLNYTEQIKTIEERIKENNEYLASRGQFSTGVKKAVGTIREEAEMFKETLGSTTVNAFRDGLVGAMDAALNKADDLESALMGVAAGFLREIQGVMLRNIANQAISSFMPSFGAPATGNQRGGFIRAQKGMYISGGRTGDKNPALLEDGEYVLNRNAVKALGGPRAIDSLNFNAFPRFATGGDPGTMSASVSMNEPFERLSMYGREQSPEFQNYVERLREEEAARDRKRAERKALLNQFIGTLISTGVSMGISSAVGAAKNASQAKANLKGAVNTDTGVAISGFSEAKKIVDAGGSVTLANGTLVNSSYFGGEAFTRSSFNQLASSRFSAEGIFPSKSGFSVQGAVPYGTGKNEIASINKTFKSPFDAVKYSRSLPREFKPKIPIRGRQEGGAIGFNQGGFLPYGSRLTDSIPAYLTGGEYVVNSKAVRKYGVGGLNRINSGVAKFQNGGMVDAETSSPSNTSNTANNNVSINITVNASGGKVGDQESDSNSEGTEGNAKELSNRIKAVVLDVITTEQRTGGLLDSTKKR